MKAISEGEFNGLPGRGDGPNHADRLDRASRVLSARMPRKKPQAKKGPSVLSGETACELIPSEVSQRPKPAQNHFPDATAISQQSERPEKFDIVSIFWQYNRKLKTASEETETFEPSLKTAIEMNEVNYRPIDSRINTLSSST